MASVRNYTISDVDACHDHSRHPNRCIDASFVLDLSCDFDCDCDFDFDAP